MRIAARGPSMNRAAMKQHIDLDSLALGRDRRVERHGFRRAHGWSYGVIVFYDRFQLRWSSADVPGNVVASTTTTVPSTSTTHRRCSSPGPSPRRTAPSAVSQSTSWFASHSVSLEAAQDQGSHRVGIESLDRARLRPRGGRGDRQVRWRWRSRNPVPTTTIGRPPAPAVRISDRSTNARDDHRHGYTNTSWMTQALNDRPSGLPPPDLTPPSSRRRAPIVGQCDREADVGRAGGHDPGDPGSDAVSSHARVGRRGCVAWRVGRRRCLVRQWARATP